MQVLLADPWSLHLWTNQLWLENIQEGNYIYTEDMQIFPCHPLLASLLFFPFHYVLVRIITTTTTSTRPPLIIIILDRVLASPELIT